MSGGRGEKLDLVVTDEVMIRTNPGEPWIAAGYISGEVNLTPTSETEDVVRWGGDKVRTTTVIPVPDDQVQAWAKALFDMSYRRTSDDEVTPIEVDTGEIIDVEIIEDE